MAVARGSQRRLSAPIEARRRAPVPAKNSTDREERLIPWDVDGLKELLNGCRLHDVTGFFVPGEMRENPLVTRPEKLYQGKLENLSRQGPPDLIKCGFRALQRLNKGTPLSPALRAGASPS